MRCRVTFAKGPLVRVFGNANVQSTNPDFDCSSVNQITCMGEITCGVYYETKPDGYYPPTIINGTRVAADATLTPTLTTSLATSSMGDPPNNAQKSNKPKIGIIAGSVVGGVVLLAVIAGAAILYHRKYRKPILDIPEPPSATQELRGDGGKHELPGPRPSEIQGPESFVELPSNHGNHDTDRANGTTKHDSLPARDDTEAVS